MADKDFVDVKALLSQLTLSEKVELLAGQGSFRMTGLERHGIPGLIVSPKDGYSKEKYQSNTERLQMDLTESEAGDHSHA
ncbi:hypothetical protein SNK05_006112 [Fusarium graminearum]